MNLVSLLAGAGLYILLSRAVVRYCRGTLRDVLFALLNLAAVYALFFPIGYLTLAAVYCSYVVLAVLQYGVLRSGAMSLAFIAPIAVLVVIKAGAALLDPSAALPGNREILPLLGALIGISYFAFRTSYLVLEVRNGQVARPSLWQYLGFCFFAPTMAVGPINRYTSFHRSLELSGRNEATPAPRAALRLLVGAVKYRFLAGIFDHLSYGGLLLDGHPHHWIDLGIAAVAYYLFLYCNFSGFCDMAIGAAGLIGISIEENFKDPFAARNVRDFWNRWHITLSAYMRDVVFTPTSKFLAGIFGARSANHVAAIAIVLVFLLIGIWHGIGWNYLAFGAMHAVGVVTTHYYTIWLKRRLGRERFAAYNGNPWIRAVAIAVTFVFVTVSFFLFANSVTNMQEIFMALVWS